MRDHGDNENMNTLTTIRITTYAQDLHNSTTGPVEDSDAESFHSAITSATNAWIYPTSSHKTHTYMIKYEPKKNDSSRPGTATKVSDDRHSESQLSRPSSRRSSKSSPSVPRRKSSLGKRRTTASRKANTTALHRKSCQIFSSLDGVLALSREITPLPSVSSSRSATRHPSLIPEEASTSATTNMAQMCEKLDAKLAYTYSYSYSLNTDSTSSIPLQPPKPNTGVEPDTIYGQIAASETARRLNKPQSDIHSLTPERPPFDTVISWTSDETRRKEYAKIDRANSGLRGLLRRLMPRHLLSKNSRRDFFTGKCDGDSVRRFRMDVPDDDAAADNHPSEDPGGQKAPPEEASIPALVEGGGEGECEGKEAEKNLAHSQEPLRRKWSCF
ncbi:uncharacterized protein A1O9_01377 [Exophiala aquamarina CBS 119918]|uniref:Uncharacterized protein n=1 Tax=Exophiala aquamarina CBS 119918 TaxID=1182545 RepID=A0A072PTH8_9EURO|nr:uncharacterized protein A1O9_01377 [Exophiala aquamarina CBS 119918]KEF63399.1 hypothetical protein A1O9_01377 [Exophiala aquamarina CBS 119918]